MEIGLRYMGMLAPVLTNGDLLDQRAKSQLQTSREILIAPCGMDCAICAQYLARQNEVKKKANQDPLLYRLPHQGQKLRFYHQALRSTPPGESQILF